MRRAVENFDADVIISAPFPLNHMSYGFENRKKAPVILVGCIHTADRHGFHNPWIIEAIKKADGYVALTQHEANFLANERGIDIRKIAIIGVGVDIPPPSAAPGQIRQQLGIDEQTPLIAFVGQHGLHKGLETLIKATAFVWHTYPDAHLLIAGGTTPFTDGFKRQARYFETKTRTKQIHFMDNIDEKQKYDIIEACDIFVTPSGFESFGITILEAWTKKKPVIACNIEATRSLITHNKTGILVPYKDIAGLSLQIRRLIEKPHLGKKLGENGFKHLKNNYTREIVGQKYRNFASQFT
jgi:glycosyltransferase involved in cell wall biosynthesis